MNRDDPHFRDHLDRWLAISETWDDPKLDEAMLAMINENEEAQQPSGVHPGLAWYPDGDPDNAISCIGKYRCRFAKALSCRLNDQSEPVEDRTAAKGKLPFAIHSGVGPILFSNLSMFFLTVWAV